MPSLKCRHGRIQQCFLLILLLLLGMQTGAMHREAGFPFSSGLAVHTAALATWQCRMVGLSLRLPTAPISIPKNAPFAVKVSLWFGDKEASSAQINALGNTQVKGLCNGQEFVGTLGGGIDFPTGLAAGDYTLANVRLVQAATGQTIAEGQPSSVKIKVFEDIIISQVSSAPMDPKDAGIDLGPGSYVANKFTFGMTLGSDVIQLHVPVLSPKPENADPAGKVLIGKLDITGLSPGSAPDISVRLQDFSCDPKVESLLMHRPELANIVRQSLKALVVIPGSVGYLKQHYKVHLLVINTLDPTSPYVVDKLSARIKLPDCKPITDAPPLVLPEGIPAVQPILGPDASGKPGAGVATLKGGQSGLASFVLRGDKIGDYAVEFDLSGEFSGPGLESPIPMVGQASGKVLVRHPHFSMLLVHPEVVRKGEVYTLEAHLTNSSQAPAYGVRMALDLTRMTGVKLAEGTSPESDSVNIDPKGTHVFKFKLKASRNGEVRSTYFYTGGDLTGSYALGCSIGERGVTLNPATFALPTSLGALPESLKDAMLRVIGSAYSVATTKGGLPFGVLPIPMKAITQDLARDLSEQGLFLKMDVEKRRVWWRLWQIFACNADPGFRQLMQQTEAGTSLLKAFMEAWHWASPDLTTVKALPMLAQWAESAQSPSFLMGLSSAGLSSEGQPSGNQGLAWKVVDGDGAVLPASLGEYQDRRLLQVELRQRDRIQKRAQRADRDKNRRTGRAITLQATFRNQTGVMQSLDMAAFSPQANQIYGWDGVGIPAGAALTLTLSADGSLQAKRLLSDGSSQIIEAQSSAALKQEGFQVLAVHRYDLGLDASANEFGTHVMCLFNRPNRAWTPEDAKNPALLVKTQLNDSCGAQPAVIGLSQAFPRAVSLYLDLPVGPYVDRSLAFSEQWRDCKGNALQGALTWPILSSRIPGGALVKGNVRKASGEGLAAKMTYISVGSNNALVAKGFGTDDQGRFQLDYVPESGGQFLLEGATSQGNAFARAMVTGTAQTLPVTLLLEGLGTVQGYVYSRGKALPGKPVQVTCMGTGNWPELGADNGADNGAIQINTQTDSKGFYRVEKLKVGAFSVRTLDGLVGAVVVNQIPEDGAVVNQDLHLRDTGTVRARLVDDNLDGKLIMNQPLMLGIPSGIQREGADIIYPLAALPSSDGWVVFPNIPPGDIHVIARYLPENIAPGVRTVLSLEALKQAGQGSLDLTLHLLKRTESAAKVRVQVSDGLGKWVENATITDGFGRILGQTDHTGELADVKAVAGKSFDVIATHPRWPRAKAYAACVPLPDAVTTLTIAMPVSSGIEGKVTFADGAIAQGVRVAIPPVHTEMHLNYMAVTDQYGQYRLENAPVASSCRVAALSADWRTVENKILPFEGGKVHTVNFTLPLPGSNTVKGVILQADGSKPTAAVVEIFARLPFVDVPLRYGAPNPYWGEWRQICVGRMKASDQDGKFEFKNLPMGDYIIRASNDFCPAPAQYAGTFSVGAPTEQSGIQIRLRDVFAGELSGTVYHKDGRNTVGKGVKVRLLEEKYNDKGELTKLNALEAEVETQEGGTYAFPKILPAGSYFLRAGDIKLGIAATRITLQEKVKAVGNLRLWGTGKVTVTALDGEGKPLKEGIVKLLHSKASPPLDPEEVAVFEENLSAEKPGMTVFEDVLEGGVQVLVESQGKRGSREICIPDGGGDCVATVQLTALGDLHGLLTNAKGEAVNAGHVTAYGGENQWIGVSSTNVDAVAGKFCFKHLSPGLVTLRAFDPVTRQTGQAKAQVEAGQDKAVVLRTNDLGEVLVSVSRNGAPLANVGVTLQSFGPSESLQESAMANGSGLASFFVPPGEYSLRAVDPVSLSSAEVRFKRQLNQGKFTVPLDMLPVKALNVAVLPPKTATPDFSLAGWTLTDAVSKRQVSVQDGLALFRDLAIGEHVLQLADTKRYNRGEAKVVLQPSEPDPQSLEIQTLAYGSVQAMVQNADLTPHGEAKITLRNLSTGAPYDFVTDPAGRVTMPSVKQGKYSLYAVGTNKTAASSEPFELSQENEVLSRTLTLSPVASLSGVLRDADGSGVPNRAVALYRTSIEPDYLVRTGATDEHGNFAFANIALGNYVLCASVDDGLRKASAKVQLKDADINVGQDLTLTGFGTVRVRVVNVANQAQTAVLVRLTSRDVDYCFESMTDDKGLLTIPQAPAGNLSLSTVWMGKTFSQNGLLKHKDTLDLTLTVKDTHYTTISGRVLRADATKRWPQNTMLVIQNTYLALDQMGIIQVQSHPFDCSGSNALSLYSPSWAQPVSLGTLVFVKDGNTALDITAPAIGRIEGKVTYKNDAVSGAKLKLDGNAMGQTDAQGRYRLDGVSAGNHAILAFTAYQSGSKSVSIIKDDESVPGDLDLQPSDVNLMNYVYLKRGRRAGDIRIESDGSVNDVRAWASIDDAGHVPVSASMARWVEPDRQIAFTMRQGEIEFTVTRTVGVDSYLMRDEVKVCNVGAQKHNVDMMHMLPDSAAAIMDGPFQAGIATRDKGSILWGDGKWAPASNSSNRVIWPRQELAPGQSFIIALAHVPYCFEDAGGWRLTGATRALSRIKRGAPEWEYSGDPSAWLNWRLSQEPKESALPPWNSRFQAIVRDALKQKPCNRIDWQFLPVELLAQAVRGSNDSETPMENQPGEGGEVRLSTAGNSQSFSLPATAVTEFVPSQWTPMRVYVRDAKKNPVKDVRVAVQCNGTAVSLNNGMTDQAGSIGPLLLPPGKVAISATYPVNGNIVVNIDDTLKEGMTGTEQHFTAEFPALGHVEMQCFLPGVGGKPYTGNVEAVIRDSQGVQYSQYSSSGSILWKNLPVGQGWTLAMKDPRTLGALPVMGFAVEADKTISLKQTLKTCRSLKAAVRVGDQAFNQATVYWKGSDGGQGSQMVNNEGMVTFEALLAEAGSQVQLWAKDWNSSRQSPVLALSLDGPVEEPVKLIIPAFDGKLKVNLKRRKLNDGGQQVPPEAQGWIWTSQPAPLTGNQPKDTVEANWTDLPTGQRVAIKAAKTLETGAQWEAGCEVETTTALQEKTITLPVLASAIFRFVDSANQPITGLVSSGGFYLAMGVEKFPPAAKLEGFSRIFSSFDKEQAWLPEILFEGEYEVSFSLPPWDKTVKVAFSVGSDDDGRVLDIPVKLPFVKTRVAMPIKASDNETPVPGAPLYLDAADELGGWLPIASMPSEPSETDVASGFFWAPEGASYKLRTKVMPFRLNEISKQEPVSQLSGSLTTGSDATETLTLPLSVVRARLQDVQDGTWEDFSALVKVIKQFHPSLHDRATVIYDKALPFVKLSNKRWAVLLGCEGKTLPMVLADAKSGLGKTVQVAVPEPGKGEAYEDALPAYAWLSAVTLDGASDPARAIHVGVAQSAVGIVRPQWARWGYKPKEAVWFPLNEIADNGIIMGENVYGYIECLNTSFNRVRVPVEAPIWAVQERAPREPDQCNSQCKDKRSAGEVWSMNLGYPFYMGMFTALQEEDKTLAMPAVLFETTPWEKTPIHVVDQDGKQPDNIYLLARPETAPWNWRFNPLWFTENPADPMPDANGVWRYPLPVGIPARVETMRIYKNKPYNVGSVFLTPVSPVPAQPWKLLAKDVVPPEL